MYIDATSMGAVDRRFQAEVVELIRTAMQPFELQLERVQVLVSAKPEGHVCRLHAWAERGQTVVVESLASSRRSAVETATESLRRTIAGRTLRGLVAARPRGSGAPGSVPRLGAPGSVPRLGAAPIEPASEVRAIEHDGALRPRRVLLVLRELDDSSASVHWAQVLSAALEAELEVCRVLGGDAVPDEGPSSGRAWLESTRRLLVAARETRRWCAAALPGAELSEGLIASAGSVAPEVARRARERDVDWVVLPDGDAGCGLTATELARASGCPVLVARAPTRRSTLLVASDVTDDLYPISSRTAALAEALHAPVLAFHDVGFRAPELDSRVNALTEAWEKVQAERLESGGPQRLPELEVLLAYGTDRVETILQQARLEDAEIIVVGLSADADDPAAAVTAGVVDRAIRSVLVVPSNLRRAAAPQAILADDAPEPRRSGIAPALERRGWPRAGSRAQPSNERRRWRQG